MASLALPGWHLEDAVGDVRCGGEAAAAPVVSPQVAAVLVVLQAASSQLVVAPLIAQTPTGYFARPRSRRCPTRVGGTAQAPRGSR